MDRAADAPMTWPPGVKTRPEVDQEIGGDKAGGVRARSARALEALIEQFAVSGAR